MVVSDSGFSNAQSFALAVQQSPSGGLGGLDEGSLAIWLWHPLDQGSPRWCLLVPWYLSLFLVSTRCFQKMVRARWGISPANWLCKLKGVLLNRASAWNVAKLINIV